MTLRVRHDEFNFIFIMHFLIISFFVHSADVAEEEKKPAASPTVSDNPSGHPPSTLEPCVTNTAEGSQDILQKDNVRSRNSPGRVSFCCQCRWLCHLMYDIRAQLEPQQTQPGAFRVAGIDGEDEIDDDNEDIVTETAIESGIVDPNNPVSAEPVDKDEENRRIRQQIDREVAQRERERMEQEKGIPEAEITMEKNNTAFYLFLRATQQARTRVRAHHPEALFIVGLSYEDDDQFNIAEGYYEQAATLGHADAQYHLALLIEDDHERMLGYLEQAAAQDHADALYYLGTLYFDSDVVQQDLNMAREYFQRAAAQGHSEAREALENLQEDTDIDQVHELAH
jgi:hypothetical protein